MKENNIKITVIGLGYVGLPLAVEFSKHFSVTGFDLNKQRIEELSNGYDKTKEISKNKLNNAKNLSLVSRKEEIGISNVYIVTVPTPVTKNNIPDFNPLKKASSLVGSLLKKKDVVIYESTVYPGATEQICVPILEKESNFRYKKDFFCGYSPERINPGDKKHSLSNTIKITSGCDLKTGEFVDSLYNKIVTAGTYLVSSIAVAEAAKVIENVQRDVNIALVNELALIFNKIDLDTTEVLEAAGTKWNFLPFRPGLVGGHCIGVDPYYLTHKAAEVGYHPEMILAGRKTNDNMGYFIAEQTIGELTRKGISPIDAKIAILGLTFKENCSDIRNTKVVSIISSLKSYKCKVSVSDHWADKNEAKGQLNLDLVQVDKIKGYDAVILAVGHDEFTRFTLNNWEAMINKDGILMDIKSIYNKDYFKGTNIKHWRL